MDEQLYLVQVTLTNGSIFWHTGGRGNGATAGAYTKKQLPRILGRYKGYAAVKAFPVAVGITNDQHYELREDYELLGHLRDAGVDDWEGYEYALEALHGESDE